MNRIRTKLEQNHFQLRNWRPFDSWQVLRDERLRILRMLDGLAPRPLDCARDKREGSLDTGANGLGMGEVC
jgi:hypothetical protein